MSKLVFLACIAVVVCAVAPVSGTIWYVDGSAPGGTVFERIQEGIDAASDGDTVVVAEWRYAENVYFRGRDIVLCCTDPSDLGVVANTIMDGNHSGSVVMFSGREGEKCVLSGFTIRNGLATKGGGINGNGTLATIRNNVICDNSAAYGGGLFSCQATVENNTICDNSADYGGGLYGCRGVIQRNMIVGNSAGYGGGLQECPGTIQENLIFGNAADFGGGLHACVRGTIQNNVISHNAARIGGGLRGCGSATIWNNTIYGNSADTGGGLAVCSASTVQNCIIWANVASSQPQLDHSISPTYCCIQDWSEGGEGNTAKDPLLVNPDGPDENPDTYYDNDYRLLADSPCIDAGYNDPDLPETDFDGNPRIVDGGGGPVVDMGAFEFQGAHKNAPEADANGPYAAWATEWEGALVQLDGTASRDAEGDIGRYEWDLDLSVDSSGDGDPGNDLDATGPTPVAWFPIGQTDVSLVVVDGDGLTSAPDETTVTVSLIDVEIDIKPGSDPNSINLGSQGVIPVAFLTTPTFDASLIDPLTVTLRGEDFGGFVKLRGKTEKPMASLEDVDGDGDVDLLVHLDTNKLTGYELGTVWELGAKTGDGFVVLGSDTVRLVPQKIGQRAGSRGYKR